MGYPGQCDGGVAIQSPCKPTISLLAIYSSLVSLCKPITSGTLSQDISVACSELYAGGFRASLNSAVNMFQLTAQLECIYF